MPKRKKRGKFLSPGNILWIAVLLALFGLAINQQLNRSPEERTWHGSVLGIPYDLRVPTIDKLQATFWNKDNPQLLVPTAFGMGWTINFYPLFHPRNDGQGARTGL
ncbi:MAG TPA: DUF5808 domain-containing protein [Ktedonobacteraceae bacterium]|jgi:hypothetical protein|nr:DUF5808 domain-containing protein [Ktedonobacteraceae bacterium]